MTRFNMLYVFLCLVAVSCNASNFASESPKGSGDQSVSGSKQTNEGKSIGGQIEIASETNAPSDTSFTAVGVKGSLQVTVLDATNNKPIAGANVATSDSKTTATTDAAGRASITFSAVDSYLEASAVGYVGDRQQLLADKAELVLLLSPELKPEETRIILSWGDTPKDLDGHLYVQPTGGKNFHVYYLAKKSPVAVMDYDSKTGFGPETISLPKLVPGRYAYRVANFSDCITSFEPQQARLSKDSGARVRLFIGNIQRELRVPVGLNGRVWSVFNFDVDADLKVNLTINNQFADNCDAYKY
ncbi:MAG: hypothetical protein NTY08_04415 [Proteobacteria bacterium]|nr:hypothetical protein [Pseudomonadota bacterium]